MGLGKFFKSLVDNKAMAEQIIETNQKAYYALKEGTPGESAHNWLAITYMSRLATLKQKCDLDTAYHETEPFAQMPEPTNCRALGILMLMSERPDIHREYPEYSRELQGYLNALPQDYRRKRFQKGE